MAAIFRTGTRLKEFVKKYGKVALGVHFSVSAVSITGLYVAIKSNVDVESILEKVGISASKEMENEVAVESSPAEIGERELAVVKRNKTAEMAATSGGAIALAILCNKALFPVRVPITVALTPPIARFLARRRIIQNSL
ncbi:hypothetical protein QQ045_030227 [Rhodiola kirilowii]